MLNFYLRTLSFQPPLKTEKKFYISLEVVNDSSQTTEIFAYHPKSNSATVSSALEFLMREPEKISHFNLELYEFDNPAQRHMTLGKQTVYFGKIDHNTPIEVTLPTIYGTDATFDLIVELSDDFKDISLDLESPETNPKKRRHRHLEKIFGKERFGFLKKSMSYESFFGLTPVVQAIEAILEFIRWKNPHFTFGVSMLLTFIILHGQGLLALGFLGYFIFYKRIMPVLLQPAAPEVYRQSRFTTYKQNAKFFKEATNYANQGYDIYKKLFLDTDRTAMIQLLLFIRKFSPVAVIGLLIFSVRHIIVMGYWAVLLYNTRIGREMIKRGYEEGINLLSQIEVYLAPVVSLESKLFSPEKPERPPQKTSSFVSTSEPSVVPFPRSSLDDLDKVSKADEPKVPPIDETRTSLSELLLTPQQTPKNGGGFFREKTFAIYENQRWWVGKGWCTEMLPGDRPPWSDDLGEVELKREQIKLPGSNWQWQSQWNVVMSSKTDDDGWEYASRFKKFDDPQRKKSLINSVRRRKWMRKCLEVAE